MSTQCNITNIEAVRYFSSFADVMVTARELSLEQVSSIISKINEQQIKGPKGNLIKIEIFAQRGTVYGRVREMLPEPG